MNWNLTCPKKRMWYEQMKWLLVVPNWSYMYMYMKFFWRSWGMWMTFSCAVVSTMSLITLALHVYLTLLLWYLYYYIFLAWLWNSSWFIRNGCSSLYWYDWSGWNWSSLPDTVCTCNDSWTNSAVLFKPFILYVPIPL